MPGFNGQRASDDRGGGACEWAVPRVWHLHTTTNREPPSQFVQLRPTEQAWVRVGAVEVLRGSFHSRHFRVLIHSYNQAMISLSNLSGRLQIHMRICNIEETIYVVNQLVGRSSPKRDLLSKRSEYTREIQTRQIRANESMVVWLKS